MVDLRELRAVLVGVPPLLADLIRQVAVARLAAADVRLSIVAELGDLPDGTWLSKTSANLIVIRQGAAPPADRGATPVLALSSDLSRLLGPGPDDVADLTPETLAAALLEVSAREGSSPADAKI